jgi:hypothetical protein
MNAAPQLVALGLAALLPLQAGAHGNEARMVEFLDWKSFPNVTRAFGTNRSSFDGTANSWFRPQIREIEGDSCVVGELFGFDVDNRYAFDIDEPVELTLKVASQYTAPFVVGWDRNGGTGSGTTQKIATDSTQTFQEIKVTLDRARFAGQGTQGSDFAIGAPGGMALCDLKVVRSNQTVAPAAAGQFELTIKEAKTGGLIPARVGIYDKTGRAPLASDKSLMLQRFADDLRLLPVNERAAWPSQNRQAFYADGTYSTSLAAGTYELVLTRGPEFKAHKSTFEVKPGATSKVTVSMERYADMPSKGWYSGDVHIHVTRDEVADRSIWGFVAAEDVHVGNLLEMGNIRSVYFKQPSVWGKVSRFERDGHFIVSGLEAPRTRQFGHTIHLNLDKPVHLKPEDYFLYHRVFEDVAAQGGLSGFAHMGWNPPGEGGAATGKMNRGMVLLAPFGLVDFIEVMQSGKLTDDGWYRLLNLGYRVTPAAGTDWPYTDFPGTVRNFVKVVGPLNLDKWYESFNAGRTFVTNGPLLNFSVNGKGMGEEVRIKRGDTVKIAADAILNPDFDSLDRLELVVLGDVKETRSAQGRDRVELKSELKLERSAWIAVRAYGNRQEPRNTTIAHSAPVYVVVDDEPTWKRDDVPAIVAELRERLQRILTDPIDVPILYDEPWETRLTLSDQWILQQPLLRPRVGAADKLYQKLLDRWSAFAGRP